MILDKQWRLALAAVFFVIAPGAIAQKIKVDSTPGFDFTSYKRYQWRTHPVFEKKPALADTYQVGIQLVKIAVNRNLIKRGLQSVEASPDFYITFFLTAEQEQDVDVISSGGGYGWGGWYGWSSYYYPSWTETVVTNYISGMLVLDFVDAKTNELVWRAYCSGEIRDWGNRDKVVNKAVEKALKRFPPKAH